MSLCRNKNSGTRMCAMFLRDPVSRLSTQMTRWPRRRSSSHRCDPRNPAPPVTRQVAMNTQGTACAGSRTARDRPPPRSARASGLELLLGDARGDEVDAQVEALGEALLLEPFAHDRAAL